MKKLANFWKSGLLGKIVTILVSFFAICCVCTSFILVLPTPPGSTADTAITASQETIAATVELDDQAALTLLPSQAVTIESFVVIPSTSTPVLPTITVETATQTSAPYSYQPIRVHFIDVGRATRS